MSAIEKLVAELREKGIENRLSFWHNEMKRGLERYHALRRQEPSAASYRSMDEEYIKIWVWSSMIRGAVDLLCTMQVINWEQGNEVEKQLAEEQCYA